MNDLKNCEADNEIEEHKQINTYKIMSLQELITLKRNIPKNRKILVNLQGTKYNVIWNLIERDFQWEITESANDDWNLLWHDTYISEDDLRKMLPFQRINHFPGSHHLGKKNELGKNLRAMRKVHPQEYDFFPKTWLLPVYYKIFLIQIKKFQSEELRQHHTAQKSNKPVYIVKPEASCQGRGIFLCKKPEASIGPSDRYVVQEYLKNPLLIDGLKFDFRVYVLLKSVCPMKIFMYREGLGRLATKTYAKPSKKNMTNMCMHLTNYAINKKSKDFIFNNGDDSVGHKRSLSAVLIALQKQGYDVEKIFMNIRQVIVKTLCSVQPYLAHIYRACQPRDDLGEQCFEVFGFDIILDENLKAWLLEVNHTPSFATDTELDTNIKKNLITDTLLLMNIKNKLKKLYYEQKRAQTYVRPYKKTQEEKLQYQKKVEKLEQKNINGFIKIYPSEEDPTNYNTYLESAQNLLDEWAGTTKQVNKRAIIQTVQLPPHPTIRKQSLPQREVIKRPSSGIQQKDCNSRPQSTVLRIDSTKDKNLGEIDYQNSSLSGIEIDSPSMIMENQIEQSIDLNYRKQQDPQVKQVKPLSANVIRNAIPFPQRNQIIREKRRHEQIVFAAKHIYPLSFNTWVPPTSMNPIEILKHQLLEEKQLKTQLLHNSQSQSQQLKARPEYQFPSNKKILNSVSNSNTSAKRNDTAANNENFIIKKVQMVPIKNFNFKDKLTNLLNIQKE